MSSFSNLVMTSRGDSVAADDFAMALPSRSCQPFILNQAVVCSRQFSSAGFLGLQSETGVVRIKSFIDDLDSLDGDGQRW